MSQCNLLPIFPPFAGVKSLATVLVGVLKPPDTWESMFGAVVDEDEKLDGDLVRLLLLERCAFTYIVHDVKSSSLTGGRVTTTTLAASDEARAAAAALGETAGAFASNVADHQHYTTEFLKQFEPLVRIILFSMLSVRLIDCVVVRF